jgi:L-ascorbate metabolism protein UlaG (beta-lactamase superfamily)
MLKKKGQKDVQVSEVADQAHTKPIASSSDPRITWLGHSTFLIQVAGINIITDPMLFDSFPIFKRRIPCPLNVENFPKIDVIIISHNHKDHLDLKSLQALKAHNPLLLVPIGNKNWFCRKGFGKVLEKTWWELESITGKGTNLSLSFLPAIHWTSRSLFDINKSLWGSWMIDVNGYKIYFAGDTAYGDHFTAIANRYSPINVALMPIGPNEPRRFIADSHINSEEAVKAFIELGAQNFIPMHWGTFSRMGAERHDDPLVQLEAAWEKQSINLSGTMLHKVQCGNPLCIK